jgi:hypothetical protein
MSLASHRAKRRQQAEELTDDERVRAALVNELPVEALSEIEEELFYDVVPFMGPSPEAVEFYRQMRRRGGGVGCDKHGRLVRGLPGGHLRALRKPKES